MQKRLVVVWSLVLVFAVSACGGPAVDEADPVAVARVAAEAWMRSDVDSMIEVSCKRMREQLEASREQIQEMAEMMNSMGVDMKDVRFDFSDVSFEVVHQEEFTAKVKMSGPMKVSIPGRSDETAPQDMELSLVQEDGHWKLCSEIN